MSTEWFQLYIDKKNNNNKKPTANTRIIIKITTQLHGPGACAVTAKKAAAVYVRHAHNDIELFIFIKTQSDMPRILWTKWFLCL